MYVQNNVSVLSGTINNAVPNGGTFTVDYPAGTAQASFDSGLFVQGGSYFLLNNDVKQPIGNPGIGLSFGASSITATNNTGAAIPANTPYSLNLDRQDGNTAATYTVPIKLNAITAAGDVLTEVRLGVDGVIENVEFAVSSPVTTAAKLATLNLEIGTTDVTGGVIALTSANATPLGKVIPGTAVTGNNKLTKESKLSVEASGVTAFSEGEGFLNIRIRRS